MSVADQREVEDLLTRLAIQRSGRRLERLWAIDCETTGVGHDDRIVTFAAVEMLEYWATGRIIHLIFNPGRPSQPAALRVHGWSDEVLAMQQPFADLAEEIAGCLNRADGVVAHNSEFDIKFLNRELRLAGVPIYTKRHYCTMREYKKMFPRRRYRLDDCIKDIGLSRDGSNHGALEDAFLAANLHSWMRYGKRNFFRLDEWSDPSNLRK